MRFHSNIKLITFIFTSFILISFTPLSVCAEDLEQFPKVTLRNSATVQFDMDFGKIPLTENDKIYLYELWPFEYRIGPDMKPVNTVKATRRLRIKFDFNDNRLYKKYVLAGYKDGRLTQLCTPQYIVNPELLATNSKPRKERFEFCTQTQGMANIPLTGRGGILVSVNTMQVLNSRANEVITHPLARKGVEDPNPVDNQYYFMLNAAEAKGIEGVTKELSWYAKNTAAQDFIIGNEVSNRMWNNMAFIPWEDFVREYINLYRVSYNAIKSTNKNARVYISLDGNWDRNREPDHWEYHT